MKRANVVFLFIIFCLYLVLRVLYLDADVPIINIIRIADIDEFYYSIGGFNLYYFGDIKNSVMPLAESDLSPFATLLDLFTYISLTIFGNNYYGLRMASVLAACLIFVLIILILRKTVRSFFNVSKFRENLFVYLILIYFSLDFSFLIMSRICEPTIYRSLSMVVVVYFFAHVNKLSPSSKMFLPSFLIGIISMATVFFVYFYNIFIVAAAFISFFLFIKSRGMKYVFKCLVLYGAGALLTFVVYDLYVRFSFGKSFISYLELLSTFSDRVSGPVVKDQGILTSAWHFLRHTFLRNFGTNMFKFNLPFLFAFLSLLPVYLSKVFKEKKVFDLFVVCLIGFWFLQTMFENSFPDKRHTIMFPLFILVIIYSIDYFHKFLEEIKDSLMKRWCLLFYYSFILAIGYLIFKGFGLKDVSSSPELMSFNIFNGILLLLMFLIFILVVFRYLPVGIVKFVPLFFILPSFCLYLSQVVQKRTYSYRDMMIEMGEHVDYKNVVGGISYAVRLYNKSIPSVNSYAWMYHNSKEYNKRVSALFNSGLADHIVLLKKDSNDNFYHRENSLSELDINKNIILEKVGEYKVRERTFLLFARKSTGK
jgi:hypothetical protein